jgi:hypothetical protein
MPSSSHKLTNLIDERKVELQDTIKFFIVINRMAPNIKTQDQYIQIIKKYHNRLHEFAGYENIRNFMDGYDKILTHLENPNDQAWLFIALKGILYTKLIHGLNFFHKNISEEKRLTLANNGIDISSEISEIKNKLMEITRSSQRIPFANLNKENSSVKNAKQFYDFHVIMIAMIETSLSISDFLIPEIKELNATLQTNQYLKLQHQSIQGNKRERYNLTYMQQLLAQNEQNYASPPKKAKYDPVDNKIGAKNIENIENIESRESRESMGSIDLRMSDISISDKSDKRDSLSDFIGGSSSMDYDDINPLRPSAEDVRRCINQVENDNRSRNTLKSVYNCANPCLTTQQQSQLQLQQDPVNAVNSVTPIEIPDDLLDILPNTTL